MKFEITIEGPSRVISRIHERLKPFSPGLEKIEYHDAFRGEMGRIVILEDDEQQLDGRLAAISGQFTGSGDDAVSRDDILIRVRNLAYSEPYTGSGRFSEPFNPIPSLTVRPWKPGLETSEDPRTIILDCPHAFGTGKHPTTVLCLRFLERMADMEIQACGFKDGHVLDFGCGTGILALAAVKMGAAEALGVEIDPDAALSAKRNIGLNHLDQAVEIREGSWEAAPGCFDLILANVVAGVLLREGAEIPVHLKPGGLAVVSGFSEKQEGAIRPLFEGQGLTVCDKATERGWCAFVLRDNRSRTRRPTEI